MKIFVKSRFLALALALSVGHSQTFAQALTKADQQAVFLYRTAADHAKPVASDAPTWKYGNFVDRMSGEQQGRYATLRSANVVELKFPYQGGTTATLRVNSDPKDGIAKGSIRISDGQYSNGLIRVRFDDGKVTSIHDVVDMAGGTADGKTAFFKRRTRLPKQDFFSLIKTSKRLKFEVWIYDNGSQIFEFGLLGLDPAILPDKKPKR